MMLRRLALALGVTLVSSSFALAADDPGAEEAFRRAHTELVALVDADASDARLEARADALLDHHAIAAAALGGNSRYAERCGEHCSEFEALLGQLVRHNVLVRLRAKDRGRVEVLGTTVRKKASKVDTRVHVVDAEGNARTVRVSYVMHRVDGRWRVRDIHTDGVSLVGNVRHELRALQREGGIERVMSRLREKVAQLQA